MANKNGKSMSLNDMQSNIYRAWSNQHPINPTPAMASDSWITDIYPDDGMVIVASDGKYYQVSYAADENGDVTFGADLTEVANKETWEAGTKAVYLKRLEDLKIGARNNATDMDRLKKIQSLVQELLGSEQAETPEGDTGKSATLVQIGEEVKALETVDGKTKVGGYLVRFTPKGDYDLSTAKDRFDASTDFDFEFPGKSTTYFDPGMNRKMGKRRLSPVTLSRDDTGVWMEGLLDERNEYEAGLAELARAGKLGASSGVPSHLVERETEGKGNLIKYWPLGKDASYTHTPAEYRNVIMPLKSVFTPLAGVNKAPIAAAAAEPTITPSGVRSGKSVLSEVAMTEEELKAMMAQVAKEAGEAAATKAVEEFKKAQPASVKAGVADPATVRDPNDRPYKSILGKSKEAIASQYKALGEQLLDIRAYKHGSPMSSRLLALESELKAQGMSEFINSDGGFALQPDFTAGLLDKTYNPPGAGSSISDVTTQPVSGNGFRALAVDETSRVSSRRGGFVGYWVGEGTAPTASNTKLRRVGTDLEKVIALTWLTNELVSDAPALGAFVNREAPNALRFQVEDKVVNGSGAGVPLGIMKAAALITITKEAGQAAGTIVTENITKMWARMPMYLMSGAKWYCNQEILPQLLTLSLAVGLGGQVVPVNIYQPPTGMDTAAPFGRLFGRPVQPVEYCAALGTAGDLMLSAMGEYFVIDNGGIQSASSIHVSFTTDETALRFTYRVNGFPWWAAPMTPYKGSNTLSPYIVLGAR